MTHIYAEDHVTLDSEKVTERDDPVHGKVTVFHDVPIASEIVHEYPDGMAYKSRDELESYAWTVDGRWVCVGSHPSAGVVSDREQVHGRTVNPRYVKDLKDPKTNRPNRAGVRADVEIFNSKVPPAILNDMRNGKKQDVSIGFFYSMDATPGTVEDGPFKGAEYDYVQRNMFHDHLAAGIDNGRCPSPYCGLSADELKEKILGGDPFAGFENWDDCVSTVMEENPEYSREQAEKVCGKLKSKYEDKVVEERALDRAKRVALSALWQIMEETEELKGELDAYKDIKREDWWRRINWRDSEMTPLYHRLSEDTRKLITEAGLCPTCGQDAPRSEAERAMSHFEITEEEWEAMSEEEKQEYIDKLPERGSGDTVEYEDGPAFDFKLIPVDSKEQEDDSEETEEGEDEGGSKEESFDVSTVLERAERVLGAVRRT